MEYHLISHNMPFKYNYAPCNLKDIPPNPPNSKQHPTPRNPHHAHTGIQSNGNHYTNRSQNVIAPSRSSGLGEIGRAPFPHSSVLQKRKDEERTHLTARIIYFLIWCKLRSGGGGPDDRAGPRGLSGRRSAMVSVGFVMKGVMSTHM